MKPFLTSGPIPPFSSGEGGEITGDLLTLRDGTLRKIFSRSEKNVRFLRGKYVYFCGPTPPLPGQIIGSCGPTTSSRMEPYFEQMGRAGVKALIGKGEISPQAMKILEAYHMAYFTTIGGIGAFLSEKVQAAQIICFPELGPEAVFCLSVKGFPVFYEIY